MEENNKELIVRESSDVMSLSGDNLLEFANMAQKRVDALKIIMNAAISATTEYDWCLIGGKPYLQESGATKIARLFGVSWTIDKPEIITDIKGYKTYIFKGIFSFKNDSIEAEGSRSMRDEFFAGKGCSKTADEIDERDVRMGAYTNCINNGIKRLIPGLRNITTETLESAGVDVSKINGYTFKTGSKGGTSKTAEASGLTCSACGKPITQAEAAYSESKFGKRLCRDCQKNPPVQTSSEEHVGEE